MTARSGPRIMSLPARINRRENPCTSLLADALERHGAVVDDFRLRDALLARPDLLHVHWPDFFAQGRVPGEAVLRAAAFMTLVTRLRLAGTTVIWTAHNVEPHDDERSPLQRALRAWFVRRADGVIAMTGAGRAALVARHPVLVRRPVAVIPHGSFQDAYPRSLDRAAARERLGLPPDATVVAFLGAIRPYKNLPGLIAAFRALPDPRLRLLICGQPWSDPLAREIRAAAARDSRIRPDLRHLPAGEVQVPLLAADLVALPYRERGHSGAAILALSFDRPVLLPGHCEVADAGTLAGAGWLRTYHGDLDAGALAAALTWAAGAPRSPRPPLEGLDWDPIAREHLAFFAAAAAVAAARRKRTRPFGLPGRSGRSSRLSSARSGDA